MPKRDERTPDYLTDIIDRLGAGDPITQAVLDRVPVNVTIQFPVVVDADDRAADLTVIIEHGTLRAYRRGEWPN